MYDIEFNYLQWQSTKDFKTVIIVNILERS